MEADKDSRIYILLMFQTLTCVQQLCITVPSMHLAYMMVSQCQGFDVSSWECLKLEITVWIWICWDIFLFVTNLGPAQYNCECDERYYGDGFTCLPRLGEVGRADLEKAYIGDYYGFYNISEMKYGKEFLFFPVGTC